jgi:type II restriction enzyme
MDRTAAKRLLDVFLAKQRAHWYKPIQIAEILYKKRTEPSSLDILDLETYRTKSKKWRDDITIELLGRKSTSSARFQDDLFNNNAIPPRLLNILNNENIRTGGAVEAYIYRMFGDRHSQLSNALHYATDATPQTFNVTHFINSFNHETGLKRSLDKIYEIIVFALFSTLTDELELKMQLSVAENKIDLLREFEDFAKNVMRLSVDRLVSVEPAKVYRVGVTNAADRGLDMYANWGPAIQIKHLTLDEDLAENVVNSVSSDRIIIVCKSAEQGVIVSLLNQIGWKAKIQSIITEEDLARWYEKALRGRFASDIGKKLLENLAEGIADEFPSLQDENATLANRHYDQIVDEFWV